MNKEYNKAILKIVLQYLIVIVVFYYLRDKVYFNFFGLSSIIAVLVILILPITLYIKIIKFSKNIINKKIFFIYLSIPGFIFGTQLAYGYSTIGVEYPIQKILPQILLIGLIIGLISGAIGILLLKKPTN